MIRDIILVSNHFLLPIDGQEGKAKMKGSKFGAGTLAARVGDLDVFQVWCNSCIRSIGTMTGRQVTEAIIATLGRGGVLCPECREKVCDYCGKFADVRKLNNGKYEFDYLRVCQPCYGWMAVQEKVSLNGEGIPCLVVQNSTERGGE